jgi:hypothetical protein
LQSLVADTQKLELQLEAHHKREERAHTRANTQHHNTRTKITTQRSHRMTETAQNEFRILLEYHKCVVIEYESEVFLLGCLGVEGVRHGHFYSPTPAPSHCSFYRKTIEILLNSGGTGPVRCATRPRLGSNLRDPDWILPIQGAPDQVYAPPDRHVSPPREVVVGLPKLAVAT